MFMKQQIDIEKYVVVQLINFKSLVVLLNNCVYLYIQENQNSQKVANE